MASLDGSANTIVERLATTGLFTKIIVYKDTDDCTVLKSNIETKQEDLLKIRTAYNDYDVAVGAGFDIDERHYDIARWFPDRGLIYGRFGGPDFEGGEGIASYRPQDKGIIVVVGFGFPYVSSRCIPVAQHAVDDVLSK